MSRQALVPAATGPTSDTSLGADWSISAASELACGGQWPDQGLQFLTTPGLTGSHPTARPSVSASTRPFFSATVSERRMRAGFPTRMLSEGADLVTTAPAPTT